MADQNKTTIPLLRALRAYLSVKDDGGDGFLFLIDRLLADLEWKDGILEEFKCVPLQDSQGE